MANTTYLKNEVEMYVREWLAKKFLGKRFSKQNLKLHTGGTHEFDAVSQDNFIVAGIKTNSWKTSVGKLPSGKYAELFQELYFLSLVRAPMKLLVLTSEEMHRAFLMKSQGKVAESIDVIFCPLPENILTKVKIVHAEASKEQKL